MPILYQITENNGVHTLQSTDTIDFTYTLQVLDAYGNGTEVLTGTLTAEESVDFNLNYKVDGIYLVLLDNDSDTATIVIRSVYQLLSNLVSSFKEILCDCICPDCGDCDDCGNCEQLETNLSTLLKANYFYLSNVNFYAPFIEAMFTSLNTSLNKSTYYLLAEEAIKGISDTNTLAKKIAAVHYVLFYFSEYKVTATADLTALNTKYNTTEIFPCVSKLGIDILGLKAIVDAMNMPLITDINYPNTTVIVLSNTTLVIENRTSFILTLEAINANIATPVIDTIYKVRIDTLPSTQLGSLVFSSVPVIAGQEILTSDIEAGLLIYIAPDLAEVNTDEYTFSVLAYNSSQYIS